MNQSKVKAPATLKEIKLGNIDPVIFRLRNSIPVYLIQSGSQPVIRTELSFRAGSWWQSKPLTASFANTMLSEGSVNHTGASIAGKLDFHGAYLTNSSDRDNASVVLYSLEKNVEATMPLLAEIIKSPVFPDNELIIQRSRRKQGFMVEKERVENIAREKFAMALYGPDHPYGRTLTEYDFDNLAREDLVTFHAEHYRPCSCSIIVSGRFDENTILRDLDRYFGENDWGRPDSPEDIAEYKDDPPGSGKKIFIQKNGSVQSALRTGRVMFNKTHTDYPGVLVLNNILGGHFGSRLMQNVREKRGFTYGIGSALVSFKNSGYLVIVSQVGNRHRNAAADEIYKELGILCSKHVPKKELELTRSFMYGEILRAFDGPFAWSESIRSLLEHDLDTGFFHKILQTVGEIGPADLLDLAMKYFSPEYMHEVVAGDDT